mmetsp:Transcript_30491/g.76280  ORF Transcript_30491/g.76280 Transcript_30491/m.76280 type:complete len:278 (-) Transcript_30491:153-986(-)|eukprot:jgi/Tetstr1/462589/TSEL_007575.t1
MSRLLATAGARLLPPSRAAFCRQALLRPPAPPAAAARRLCPSPRLGGSANRFFRPSSAMMAGSSPASWPELPAAPASVHDFWFNGAPQENNPSLWWAGGPAVDAEVKERFGALVGAALAGELGPEWEASPRATVAKALLCDQFTRQMHRGTASAFAGDATAQSLATSLAARPEWVASLSPFERTFGIVLSCMHSESLELHELGASLLREWAAEDGVTDSAAEAYTGTLGFLVEHTEVVRRFGRYPSRNAALGRAPTPEEEAYLKTEAKPWELSQAAK